MLNEIFKALLITSLAGSCLAAVITIVKPITKKVFGYSWHYYIWLAVLFVMVLPIRFNLPQKADIPPVTAVQSVQTEQTAPTAHNTGNIVSDVQTQTDIWQTGTSLFKRIIDNRLNIFAYLWLAGMILLLSINLAAYISLIIKMRKNSVVVSCPELANFTDKRVTVRVWENTSSPFMTGIFRPTLVLPARELTEEQLNNILHHEMTHFKRHDILYKWLVSLVKCVHWFNPVIWYAAKQINTECEISCDMAVTLTMSRAQEMSYIDTVLSLLPTGKAKQIPLTTQMASSKRVLKRRFEMIRNKRRTSKFVSALSAVIAVVMLGTTVFASGVLNGSIGGNENIKYEVYNGDKKISLNSQPFIYDGEYYLPLRDVLRGFDINDIEYNNGDIAIKLPDSKIEGASNECIIKIGDIDIHYGEPQNYGVVMGAAPILKDNTTYVSTRFFEALIHNGNIIDFQLNAIRPTEPENYYNEGEKVFIGTAQEQDNYNGELVKRIIVDENGETIAVVPVDNQIADNVEQRFQRANEAASYESYYLCFYNGASGFYDANEELIYRTELNLIETLEKPYVAYIAPADIIKIPENEFNKGLRRIVTNTYKNETNSGNNLSVGKIIVDENNTVVYKGENLKNPESTINSFFEAFADSNFTLMKNYCTENGRNTFFGDGYCFGMTKAELTDVTIVDDSRFDFVAFVGVKMTPHEGSVFLPDQTSTGFYLILKKQNDGRYLIDKFATGL